MLHEAIFAATLNAIFDIEQRYLETGPLLTYILEGTKLPQPLCWPLHALKGFGLPSKGPFLSENERKSC